MSIKKYEVLLQTADLGSFTKASEVLGYTQSAISHIITGLEDELGLKLLSRDRFGVRLTAEGEALLPAIRTVCQENQEVLRQAARFHGLEVGRVRIGTFLSVSVHLLPHLLPQFLTGLILLFPHAILHEASVTFLGLGLSSEQPAIGVILSESMRYLTTGKWWLALFPGAALVLVVVLFALLGERVRLLADPASAHE